VLRVSDAPRSRLVAPLLLVIGAFGILLAGASVRAVSAQIDPADATADGDRRGGPPAINRMLGFELFPVPKAWATEDPRSARAWGVILDYPSGQMRLMGFTARSLIRQAYGLVDTPIVNAPAWLDTETFDISALTDLDVVAGAADLESFQAAMRQLVEQRLGLIAHIEKRSFPVYALVTVDPNGALGPAIGPPVAECWDGDQMRGATSPTSRRPGDGLGFLAFCGVDNNLFGVNARSVTMTELAAEIGGLSPLRPDRPVVDRTGLSGAFDFTLRYGVLPIAAIGAGHPIFGSLIHPLGFRTVYTALPEQLGLRLEPSDAEFDVLVIDSITRPDA
jgi:uncharacterized protein (TIGR03435 family)